MQKNLSIKLGAIALIALVLLVPLLMVKGKINERDSYRSIAKAELAEAWTASQRLMTPVVVLPYTVETAVHPSGFTLGQGGASAARRGRVLVLPNRVSLDSSLVSERRYRGIYEFPVYTASVRVSGEFDPGTVLAQRDALSPPDKTVSWGRPFLSVVISDPRGLEQAPVIHWDGLQLATRSGSGLPSASSGVNAELPTNWADTDQPMSFELDLTLRGMEFLGLIPAALDAELALRADWPHPRFEGKFPPYQRSITQDGFSARWKTNQFASNFVSLAAECGRGNCEELVYPRLGVSLIEPVDIYSQARRSAQYGMLFVGLSFITFFVFEVLRSLRIHPVEYLLVGLALAVFYLLLLSMAEHAGFGRAYLMATVACVSLLGFYLRHVLDSGPGALLFSTALSGLYGLLYLIVDAEDYALLGGSLLVFAVLAAVMILTRKVDWYRVAE